MTVPVELCLLACLTLTVGLTLGLGPNKELEFTFLLPAGSTECFFQPTEHSGSMEVEYQVIAGSGLDVGFSLISPSGGRLVSDFRKSDAIHMVHPTEDGDYRLCFDNSYSKVSEKMLFFRVTVNNQNTTGGDQDEWEFLPLPESELDFRLDYIRQTLDSMYQRLERSRHVQNALRAFEARDRYLLEDNLWRVSFWSCINLLVMLAVAVTQIYTLRSLFNENKRVRT